MMKKFWVKCDIEDIHGITRRSAPDKKFWVMERIQTSAATGEVIGFKTDEERKVFLMHNGEGKRK